MPAWWATLYAIGIGRPADPPQRHSRVPHPSQVTYPFMIKVTGIFRPVPGIHTALICRTGATASPVVGGHGGAV